MHSLVSLEEARTVATLLYAKDSMSVVVDDSERGLVPAARE